MAWKHAASLDDARAARPWLPLTVDDVDLVVAEVDGDLVRLRGSLHATPAACSARTASSTASTSSATATAPSSTFGPAPCDADPPSGRSGRSRFGSRGERARGRPVIDLADRHGRAARGRPVPDLRRAARPLARRVHALSRHLDGHELGDRRGRVHGSRGVPGARRALPDGSGARRDLDDDHRRRAGQAAAPAIRPDPPAASRSRRRCRRRSSACAASGSMPSPARVAPTSCPTTSSPCRCSRWRTSWASPTTSMGRRWSAGSAAWRPASRTTRTTPRRPPTARPSPPRSTRSRRRSSPRSSRRRMTA